MVSVNMFVAVITDTFGSVRAEDSERVGTVHIRVRFGESASAEEAVEWSVECGPRAAEGSDSTTATSDRTLEQQRAAWVSSDAGHFGGLKLSS